MPGSVGKMIVPMATDVADADLEWRHIAVLMEHAPDYTMVAPLPGRRESTNGYFFWQEISNRLLREMGMDYYRRFPDDARIWTWFATTRKRAPRYWDIDEIWKSRGSEALPAFDIAARERWERFYADFCERVIRDESAPSHLRFDLWMEKIDQPLQFYAFNAPRDAGTPAPDFDLLGEELLALGAAFPDRNDITLRSVTNNLLRVAERYAPDKAVVWQARLAASVNPTIADVAAGRNAIDEARVTPMEMRFTAVDGRQVDLRELRGKVLLLDFRGVTWCGACRTEEPYMRDVYAKYREHGFEIVTITYENKECSRDFVLRYTQENGLVWPHYFDGKGAQNPYIKRFGITAVPQHFLLDQKGLLVSTDVRGKKLEPEVRRLLGIE